MLYTIYTVFAIYAIFTIYTAATCCFTLRSKTNIHIANYTLNNRFAEKRKNPSADTAGCRTY